MSRKYFPFKMSFNIPYSYRLKTFNNSNNNSTKIRPIIFQDKASITSKMIWGGINSSVS